MKRGRFTIASAVSLLLCAAAAMLWYRSFDNPLSKQFTRHGVRWEIACRMGSLCLGNGPQLWEDGKFERRKAALQETVNKEPWGSDRYRQAMDQLKALEALPPAKSPAPATAKIKYAVPLVPILFACAVLPAIWLASRKSHRFPGRVRRRLLAIVSALSLLVFLAIAALWVRSYWIGESWLFASRPIPLSLPHRVFPNDELVNGGWRASRWITSSKGYVQIYENQSTPPPGRRPPGAVGYQRDWFIVRTSGSYNGFTPPGERHWAVPGIAFSARPPWSGPALEVSGYRSLVIGLWMPALASAILPALWVRRRWRWREEDRRRRNLCLTCGYNLHANVSGVCPECGTAVSLRKAL